MATMLHSESRRLYSWWWDSHISPKNSKWLQDNLTDIDAKVKTMIKLIEEDADSFARRAEMYYKKRPELMKLVEEFYRAYRALAERYDHATGELRHAQKTMAAAFPNQIPFSFSDDSPSGFEEDSQTPDMLHPLRVLLNSDFGSAESKKGLKQLQEMFGALENTKIEEEKERDTEGELSKLNDENKNLENRASKAEDEIKNLKKALEDLDCEKESELSQLSDENQNLKTRASEAENEIKNLKKALKDLDSEKELVLRQYDESMKKVSILERELDGAQVSSRGLDEEACKVKTEVVKLREVLLRLEAERDAALSKLNEYKEKISKLESNLSLSYRDEEGLMGRAVKAEAEAQYLKEELENLKTNKISVCRDYESCIGKVSDLEKKLLFTNEKAQVLNERANRAENEVRALNKAIHEACEDKEGIVRRYEHCLERISKLESELSRARDDIKRLNNAVKMKSEKIKNVEQKCVLLETSNHALRLEADTLEKKIAIKNEELSEKDGEIERVQSGFESEHTRFIQAEATLETLRSLHSQAQREQKALALELKNGLKMLKEMDEHKHGIEEEMMQVKDENKILNESNSSSKIAMKNLESEILELKEMKERLEKEVGWQTGLTNSLQKEIYSLNGDIEGLNMRYQHLIEQIEFLGLDPESIESSVKDLFDENSILKELCYKERDEKDNLVKKLENMKQFLNKSATLESSFLDLSEELQYSHEKVKALQGEKSSLVDEKAVILSQLRAITENMQKLLERNNLLEDSLSCANVELLSLREKSKSLEELCKSLNNDKLNLLNETSTLVLQLGNVENKLENLEKRYAELEMKYVGLKKEKESTLSQVKELRTCLDIEKGERESYTFSSETRLTKMQDHIQVLQEENKSREKELEEELDKAVNAQFEIFVLQKFIQDMEQKNLSLMLECQKHVEASKLSDKVISELESENLEQQVEAEDLLDEIEKLRIGIYQVFKALEVKAESFDKMDAGQLDFHRVVENIEDMKFSLANYEDDKNRLLIENSVFLTLLGEMKLEASEFELEKNILQHDFKNTREKLVDAQNGKTAEMEKNKQLISDMKLRDQRTDELKAEIERVSEEQREMKQEYQKLQDEYSQRLEKNRSLAKTISGLKKKNKMVQDEHHSVLVEALALDNKSVVLYRFGAEKAEEVISLSQDLQKLDGLKRDIENEVKELKCKLDIKENENLCLKKWAEKLEEELGNLRDINSQLTHDSFIRENQKEVELLIVKEKLKAKEDINSQLCQTVEVFKRKNEESEVMIENFEKHNFDLSEENNIQKYEIENLRDFNLSLEFEVDMLREEVEERSTREEHLNAELKEISNEFQMWEAEAETFHFDLQISTVREVFLESKVQEIGSVCETLGDERDYAMVQNEQMKKRVSVLESEIGNLKNQLSAYDPVIDSLREDIISLEQYILPQQELYVADVHKSKDGELASDFPEKGSQEWMENNKVLAHNGISELQQLQNRIKKVETIVTEEMKRRAKRKSSKKSAKLEAAMSESNDSKANYSLRFEKGKHKEKTETSEKMLQKTKHEFFEMKNGMIMTKDIPLDNISNDSLSGVSRRRFQRVDDQMLELCDTSEDDHTLGRIKKKPIEPINLSRRFESVDTSMELQIEKELGVDRLEVPTSGSESTHDRNKRKILERLNSDTQKLKSIKTTVEDLRRKLEANTTKKKKSKNVDFETVKEQLEEVEETIVQLVEFNAKLKKNVEENDKKGSPELEVIGSLRRKRVADQARKGSEKIGRLLVEVQKIQYMLLKIEEEKKNKVKIRFSKSKTSIILRDFIAGRRKGSPKRKKPCACGCFRPPSNAEGRTSSEFNRLMH